MDRQFLIFQIHHKDYIHFIPETGNVNILLLLT